MIPHLHLLQDIFQASHLGEQGQFINTKHNHWIKSQRSYIYTTMFWVKPDPFDPLEAFRSSLSMSSCREMIELYFAAVGSLRSS